MERTKKYLPIETTSWCYKALLVAYMDTSKEFTENYDKVLETDCQGKAEKILRTMHRLVQESTNNGFYLHR